VSIEQWRRERICEVYALRGCHACHGTGHASGQGTCACVLRAACRIAVGRWRRAGLRYPGNVKEMLFRCDVEIAAAHALDRLEMGVFRLHFLGYARWPICCRALAIGRGKFFHTVYLVERRLGRELLRRGIFPLEQYFDFGRQPISAPRHASRAKDWLCRGDFELASDDYALEGYSEPPAALMRSAA
jgi:hypothetical protein